MGRGSAYSLAIWYVSTRTSTTLVRSENADIPKQHTKQRTKVNAVGQCAR